MPPELTGCDLPYRQTLHRLWFPANTVAADVNTVAESPLLLDWLKEPGSLTARLDALSQGDLSVEIISQRWGKADLSESQELSLTTRAAVLVREVMLKGKGENWVYARTIMPVQSLTGSLKGLAHLKNRPLGSWLFQQPSLRRGGVQISKFSLVDQRLSAISSRLPSATKASPLWGRRSLFYVNEKPILVAEVFLPDFISTIGS